MGEIIDVPHPDENRDVVVPVRWKRRDCGGWTLIHAETKRELGWIVRSHIERNRPWAVRICPQAFRGGSATDTGDVLDRVPHWLYDGSPTDAFISHVNSNAQTRWDAAFNIVWALVTRRAPAVGFPRHPEVDTSRTARYRAAMADSRAVAA